MTSGLVSSTPTPLCEIYIIYRVFFNETVRFGLIFTLQACHLLKIKCDDNVIKAQSH